MNLLPDSRKQALTRLYLVRVAVVAALLLSGVLFVHAALVLPTLLYWRAMVQERTVVDASLGAQLAGSGEQQVSTRVKTLTDSATALSKTASGSTGSGAIRAIVGVPHNGVLITGISYGRAGQGDNSQHMTIVGRAASREALRSYATVLGAQRFISNVDLPISAYAKESDIDFTITLTGSFLP